MHLRWKKAYYRKMAVFLSYKKMIFSKKAQSSVEQRHFRWKKAYYRKMAVFLSYKKFDFFSKKAQSSVEQRHYLELLPFLKHCTTNLILFLIQKFWSANSDFSKKTIFWSKKRFEEILFFRRTPEHICGNFEQKSWELYSLRNLPESCNWQTLKNARCERNISPYYNYGGK